MDGRSLKRISVFAGHYGSGKTNVAVNYALKIKELGKEVSITDLDIVNPGCALLYFCSRHRSCDSVPSQCLFRRLGHCGKADEQVPADGTG